MAGWCGKDLKIQDITVAEVLDPKRIGATKRAGRSETSDCMRTLLCRRPTNLLSFSSFLVSPAVCAVESTPATSTFAVTAASRFPFSSPTAVSMLTAAGPATAGVMLSGNCSGSPPVAAKSGPRGSGMVAVSVNDPSRSSSSIYGSI